MQAGGMIGRRMQAGLPRSASLVCDDALEAHSHGGSQRRQPGEQVQRLRAAAGPEAAQPADEPEGEEA